MKPIAISALVLATSCAAVVPAPQDGTGQYGPLVGESLLTFGGSLSRSDPDGGSDTDSLTGQVGGGYFLDEHQEVGGQLLFALLDGDGFEANIYQVAPFYNYNFRQSSRTWYYAGPHIGLIFTDFEAGGVSDDDTSLSYGVHGGVRQWMTPRTSWFIEPRITQSSEIDDFSILFGLNVAFGG